MQKIKLDKAQILGCPCVPVKDLKQANQIITSLVENTDCASYSVAINAEKVMRFQSDLNLKKVIEDCPFPFPDGAGAVLGLRLLNKDLAIKIDLPHLILNLANEKNWSVFVAGSTEEVNSKAVDKIKQKYPKISISGRVNGFHDEDYIFDVICDSSPQVILLALGSPKQEIVAGKFAKMLNSGFIIGCGGALDVLAGHANRAPNFMINNNLEWLYRLYSNPGRWKRQLVLPVFFFKVLIATIKKI